MVGGTQKTNYADTGVRLYAGFKRLSYQHCRILDSGSLANTACYRHNRCRHHNRFPHLEAQTR